MRKKAIKNQVYEDYWQLTLEYSDFYGEAFNVVLGIIVEYIDKNVNLNEGITKYDYKKLQEIISNTYSKSDNASTRKSINQFYKLGFINNSGKGYHHLTKEFLAEEDVERKKLLYSQIVYDNAAFCRSYSKQTNVNQVKFLIKTLEHCKEISKNKLLAIMFTDVEAIKKGYLTENELNIKFAQISLDKTDKRKYNQRNYLFNLCSNLTDVYVNNNVISLDSTIMVDTTEKSRVRDPYLQRLYKKELINEFKEKYKCNSAKCVMEKLAYPILIASHIKPYSKCLKKEEFDPDNGLLLSKNMDSLFDNGYITFKEDGEVEVSPQLDCEVAKYVKQFKIDSKIYNEKRKEYMKYHKENVFKK